jgi:type VI secretion system protein ImpF
MARIRADQDLIPSVLDRLRTVRRDGTAVPQGRRGSRLDDLKAAVRNDLADLLNTKRPPVAIGEGLRHLPNSLLAFGLPDLTDKCLTSADDRASLKLAVEDAIRRFEPRLTRVVVTLIEGREFDRGLRFRIDGALVVEPTPEPVTFGSVLDLSTKTFEISAE